jgi:hypothetical protein
MKLQTHCPVRRQLETEGCSTVRKYLSAALSMLDTIGHGSPAGLSQAHSECSEAQAISCDARSSLDEHALEHGC